ncbi:LuxR C-terminal-related transcriptional regulator [Devosia sp. CN2-171]|jgi:two-component system, NarL family, nitrate/nitrite response regulator NarL|uniref:LuxR C-terminal-related transcriptional regulator n=1 Tax=Devosia sp. CN2-171 TaxID=3400909 RepID=UPI003BF7F971
METGTATVTGTATATGRTNSTGRTRLVFVDDHPTLLTGIAALFDGQDDFEIVGTGTSAAQAVELAASVTPDVISLDLSMPGDVFSAIGAISELSPLTRMIVFTAYADVDMALRVLDAGVHGFVLKGRPSSDLFECIGTVMAGGIFVSPEFSQRLMAGFRNRTRRVREQTSTRLSAREQQIVQCLFEAKSNKEIARTLNLTEKTVKHYMTNLMNKLRVKNRLEVVLAAQRMTGPSAILVPQL